MQHQPVSWPDTTASAKAGDASARHEKVLTEMQAMPVLGNILIDNLSMVNQNAQESSLRILERLQAMQAQCHDSLGAINRQLAQAIARNAAGSGDGKGGEPGGEADLIDLVIQAAERNQATLEAIQSVVLDINGDFQFQDVMRQQIEQVCVAIEELSRHFARLVASHASAPDAVEAVEACPPLTALIERLEASYVMQTQRAIHAHALGRAMPDDEVPKIELF